MGKKLVIVAVCFGIIGFLLVKLDFAIWKDNDDGIYRGGWSQLSEVKFIKDTELIRANQFKYFGDNGVDNLIAVAILNNEPINGTVYHLWSSWQNNFIHKIIDKFIEKRSPLIDENKYKNGKKDGVCKEWFENGQLKVEENWKDGWKEGVARHFYANGQLWIELNWKDGYKSGKYRLYYENGQLWAERSYYEGMTIYKKCWDKFGNIDEDCSTITNYINSLKNEK